MLIVKLTNKSSMRAPHLKWIYTCERGEEGNEKMK